MLQKILPIILLLIGSGAGIGAGKYLQPAPQETGDVDAGGVEEVEADLEHVTEETGDKATVEYVKLNNQFVVPIVTDKKVSALIVMSLSLEVPETQRSEVFRHEPKLRDSFLQVLFDHANIGGFDGAFTRTTNLNALRRALTEIGQRDIGKDIVKDVLITEIARQDY